VFGIVRGDWLPHPSWVASRERDCPPGYAEPLGSNLTSNTYGHLYDEARKQIAQRMDDAFSELG
jgi:hypothetical protein